jgi:hypothetical protein
MASKAGAALLGLAEHFNAQGAHIQVILIADFAEPDSAIIHEFAASHRNQKYVI